MNKQELVKALEAITPGDKESNHIDADLLLLEYINSTEVTKAFDDIGKWYA